MATVRDIQLPGLPTISSVAPYPVDDDQDPEAYAGYTRRLWDEQEETMDALQQVWLQSLLYLSGRQWWKRGPLGVWAPEKGPEWRERPVSNLCMAYFKTFLAKATKNRPAFQAVPASSDPKDVQAADLAEQLLEAKWLEMRLGSLIRRAVAWVAATGNCWLYPYWRTDTGRIVPLTTPIQRPKLDPMGEMVGTEDVDCPCDEDGEPYLDEDGMPDLNRDPAQVDEGDLGVRVYSGFQIRVNPEAETDDDVTWFVIAESKTLRELKDRYPEVEIASEPVGRLDDYENVLSGIFGGSDMQLVSSAEFNDRDLPKALVLHYHEKPSAKFPEGRYWSVVNRDKILEGPGPLSEGIWPALIHMVDVPIPGRYYAMATMEQIIGLNREYNEINGAIKEHHALMARGKWLVERGSGVTKGSITTQPGEVLTVNPGFQVKQVEIRALPEPVYGERERVLNDFELVSGIHKVSMGKAPPGVTAGVAFLQLQEADDTDLGPFLAMLEESVAELARAFLKIAQARYITPRLIHVVGQNKRYLARSFRASDLEGAVDVRPITGSSFPWSQTAKQSMLIQLASALPMLFSNPETGQFDTQKFVNSLPLGGIDAVVADEDLDVQEALREQDTFETYTMGAELPMVEPWQNHVIHYREHIKILKSETFKDWAPEAQEAYKQHVGETDMARQQALQAAMMPQAGPGGPGGPGGPPVPAGGPPAGTPPEAAGPMGMPMPPGAPPVDLTGGLNVPQPAQDLDRDTTPINVLAGIGPAI